MTPTTASLLPTFPRIFFLYVEPVLIVCGLLMHYDLRHDLTAASQTAAAPLPLSALVLPAASASYLLCMLAYGPMILLASPPSKRLLQMHIVVLAGADFVLWAGLFSAMAANDPRGWAAVLDTESWEPDAWNLVLGPAVTLAVKFLTLTGVFGEIKG
ncbi:hypothetical protein F4780DRAFT_124096 [Xylariomycetidae sp. FL0641]|nr:hypothetical protein F4780DRAFT_124096 [Xylariomycetidae sp. FL0641]